MTLLAAGAGPPPPSPLCAFEQLYSSASDREKKQKQNKKNNIQLTPKYDRYARLSSSHLRVAYKINSK